MSNNRHYTFLAEVFQAAPINQRIFSGSELRLAEGSAEYRLAVKEDFFHAAMAMHGAVYFKMLDDAAYFAAATLEQEYFIVTKSYEIHFVRPVTEGQLTARGTVIEAREGEWLAQSEIINEHGKVVGKGQGLFVRSRQRFSDIQGS